MHLIYLDESGDPGARNSPTSHYVLAGFAVHHSAWSTFDQKIKSLRLKLERRYGYPVTKELHACELLGAATRFLRGGASGTFVDGEAAHHGTFNLHGNQGFRVGDGEGRHGLA